MLHQGCALLFDGQQFEHCGGPTDGARLALQFVTTRELKQSPATTGNSVRPPRHMRQTLKRAAPARRLSGSSTTRTQTRRRSNAGRSSLRIQTPKKMRESSGEEGETGRRCSREYVRGDVVASTERELQALRVEVAALKAENRTLRAFAGMGGKRRKRARSRERGRDRDRDRDRDRRHRRRRRSRSRSRHHSPIGSSSSSISDWMSS